MAALRSVLNLANPEGQGLDTGPASSSNAASLRAALFAELQHVQQAVVDTRQQAETLQRHVQALEARWSSDATTSDLGADDGVTQEERVGSAVPADARRRASDVVKATAAAGAGSAHRRRSEPALQQGRRQSREAGAGPVHSSNPKNPSLDELMRCGPWQSPLDGDGRLNQVGTPQPTAGSFGVLSAAGAAAVPVDGADTGAVASESPKAFRSPRASSCSQETGSSRPSACSNASPLGGGGLPGGCVVRLPSSESRASRGSFRSVDTSVVVHAPSATAPLGLSVAWAAPHRVSCDTSTSGSDGRKGSALRRQVGSCNTDRSSLNIFDLQRQVANALTDGAVDSVDTASDDTQGPAVPWGASGHPFRPLRLYLQAIGLLGWRQASSLDSLQEGFGEYTNTCNQVLARAYIFGWHVLLWGALAQLTVALLNGPGFPGPPSFFQAVQGLLLLAAIVAHGLCTRFFAGSTLPMLIDVAARWSFVRSWERSLRHKAIFFAGFAAVLASVGAAVASDGNAVLASIAAALGWTFLLTLYLLLAAAVQFCSLGLDAFALDLLNAPDTSGLCGLVGQFNVLNAAMRRAAYSVQSAFALLAGLTLALGIAALVHVALPDLPVGDHDRGGDAAAVVWAAALLLLGLWLLNGVAEVNLKCQRMPALVHSLDFGAEIDHDRWYVAAHIAGTEAGFPVQGVLVTRGAVLKLGYISLSGLCLLATRLASSFGVAASSD